MRVPTTTANTQPIVNSAQSSGATGLLFTRLNELKDGDLFVIDVAGERQTYRVFNKRTILPNQMEDALVQIRDMERDDHNAIATLVTCTPIGVSTHRLLVSGIRVPDSHAAFAYQQDDARLRWFLIGLTAFMIALLLGFAFLIPFLRRRALHRLHHRAGEPYGPTDPLDAYNLDDAHL